MAIPQPLDAETAPARTPAPRPAPSGGTITLSPMDAQDDPGAPECLPKSHEAGPWVKVEPVRVVAPTALAEVISLSDANRFAHFRIVSGAVGAYGLPRDAGGGKPVQARVLLIEAESATDAFGLLTCQSASPRTANVGAETRIDQDGGLHLHCRQGRYYVQVWSEPAALATMNELQPLLAHIAGRIEGGGTPELLSAMPDDGGEAGRRWLVRRLGSVPPSMLGAAAPPDPEKVSELLGLDRDTLMCIAAYDVPQAKGLNVVWVVRYPSETAANTAYQQYQAFLAKAVGSAWETTSLLRPRGTFLVGTWTMEEESMQYMMPQIERRLPRP